MTFSFIDVKVPGETSQNNKPQMLNEAPADYGEQVEVNIDDILSLDEASFDDYIEDMTIEELEKLEEGIIGGTAKLVGKGIGAAAKLAGKGIGAVAHRMSTAGRADSAERKLAKLKKKQKDRQRLDVAKKGIAALKMGTNEAMDPVDKKEVKKKFHNRKDKDINNDGEEDREDEYLHKKRKAISKATSKPTEDEPEGEKGETAEMNPKMKDKKKMEKTTKEDMDNKMFVLRKQARANQKRIDQGKKPFTPLHPDHKNLIKPIKKKPLTNKQFVANKQAAINKKKMGESKIREALLSVLEGGRLDNRDDYDEKFRGKGAKDMKKDHMKGDVDDTLKLAVKDVSDAGRRGPSPKARSGADKMNVGDKKIVKGGTPTPNQKMENLIQAYKNVTMLGEKHTHHISVQNYDDYDSKNIHKKYGLKILKHPDKRMHGGPYGDHVILHGSKRNLDRFNNDNLGGEEKVKTGTPAHPAGKTVSGAPKTKK